MWFWYALLAAIISGISVTFNKRILNKGVHSSVISFFLFAFGTVGSLIFLIKDGWTSGDNTFFIAVGVSAFVFSIAKTLQLNIFKQNNLSDIYPLASISPLTLYIFGVIFLGENIKLNAFWGILIMVVGVYLLNFNKENKNLFHPFKKLLTNKFSLLYLLVIFLANISAIGEKIAINHTLNGNVFYLAFWENLFLSLFVGGYLFKSNKSWFKEIKLHLPNLIFAGMLYTTLYILVISGFKEGPVALVAAIKKLEVLFVLFISYFFFKERTTKYIYLGTILMLLSVILIKL